MADGTLSLNSGSVLFDFSGNYTSENAMGDVTDAFKFTWRHAITSGTGNNQADRMIRQQTTTAATSTIDLAAGPVPDSHGNTSTFADVSGMAFRNLSTTPGENLHIGDKSTGGTAFTALFVGATDAIVLHPSGILISTAPLGGYVVGDGSSDLIYIAAATGTISFEFVIWGHSV